MRRLIAITAVVLLCPTSAAVADDDASALRATLQTAMRAAGPTSGAYVLDASDRVTLFEWRSRKPRPLASNTKLFTTAAILARLGPEATLSTSVLGVGALDASGAWQGNLYLRGGGDPTFGSGPFVRRSYGAGAGVDDLATQLAARGVTAVRGRIFGDESLFDSLRGGPYSGFGVSRYVGPISALAFNRGLAKTSGKSFQSNPPAFAAGRLGDALKRRGISVRQPPRAGITPPEATPLASAESPPLARLIQITNKRSDNFFAEMLVKRLGAQRGSASTTAGARSAMAFARRLGARPRLVDGSGLSSANMASPRHVVELLDELRDRPDFPVFLDSLPIAGIDGTLHDRMRRGPARGHCRAKTGTIAAVSTLSGYCEADSGDEIIFSVLMQRVRPSRARRLQDRMLAALADYDG